MIYLNDFFNKSMIHKLDYLHVMIDLIDGEQPRRLIRSWDYDGLDLNNLDGSPSGEIGVSHMPYWQITSLRMKIPRGGMGRFVTLEIR